MTELTNPAKTDTLEVFEQWKQSGDQIMAIIENTPSGICITNEHGIFEYVNNAYCSIYGYTANELIGMHFTKVVPEANRAWLIELHDRFIAGSNEVRGEWAVQNKDGESLFILADAVRIVGQDGRPKKVTFVTNITDRKKAENKLIQSELLLRDAVATKDKLFRIIGHDLKNFFQGVIAGAYLLTDFKGQLSQETITSRMNLVLSSSRSALELLNNLLSWAQSQTGSIQCCPKQISLLLAVNNSIQLLQHQAETKNIAIEVSIADNQSIVADSDMLNTILLNLIGNAIKFTPNGKNIIISAEECNNTTTVTVCDNGVGMSMEKLDKLFQNENQLSNVGTNGEHGTGLGLMICREFVEKHGGKIWAKSSEGKGTAFSFYLKKH